MKTNEQQTLGVRRYFPQKLHDLYVSKLDIKRTLFCMLHNLSARSLSKSEPAFLTVGPKLLYTLKTKQLTTCTYP